MLVGALLGGLVGLGLCLAWWGWPRLGVRNREDSSWDRKSTGGAALAGAVGFLFTGWWAAAVLGAVGGFFVPRLLAARRDAEASIIRTEAVASWIETLRDALIAAGGIRTAVIATAGVAPAPIRSEVRQLGLRLEGHEELGAALEHFAEDIADPTADLAIAALILAHRQQARNLRGVLTVLADSARQEATMQRRVQAERARMHTVATLVTVFSLIVLGLLVQFNPRAVAEYDKPEGQLALVLIGGLFFLGLWLLVRMGRVHQAARFLVRGQT